MEDSAARWRHRLMDPDELNTNPTESEFFRGEGFADAITREGIQNSLDARAGEDPVVVRISFHTEEDALDPERASAYFDTLWPHLDAEEVEIKDLPNRDEPVPFVAIEDFNTSGLEGDPAEYDVLSDSAVADNDFYWFWRNKGRSGKRDTKRGRWGVGKFAFPSASRINSFFGYTRRSSDDEVMLMGQSVLQVHRDPHSDGRCAPLGYFARFREDGLSLPLTMTENGQKVSQFAQDFSLNRESPGLSLVLPYPDEELSQDAVTRSAIRHYFYPILAGDLVVEVADGAKHLQITSDSLRNVTDSMDWGSSGASKESLKNLFDFTDWALDQDEGDLVELQSAGENSYPSWSESKFGDNLESLQESFEKGERISLQAPIAVKPYDGSDTLSYFHIFLEADDDLKGSEEHYLREGLTIPDISRLSRRGVRGLIVVEDDSLSSLLGDSENPAHTRWNERNEDVKDYEHGPTTVRYVVQALNKVVGYLSRPSEGTDTDLLADIFFLKQDDLPGGNHESEGSESQEDDSDPGTSSGGDSGGGGGVNRDREPFEISRTGTGFSISSREEVDSPSNARVEVAYVTGRGDSFRRYDPADFKLSDPDLDWSMSGASFDIVDDNEFDIEILNEEFSVSIEGFDARRDLTVRVTSLD